MEEGFKVSTNLNINPKDIVKDLAAYIVGGLLFAISINCFIMPNNISQAGFTGISLIFNHLFGTPVGILITLLNIPFLIWALLQNGVKFIFRTLIATFFIVNVLIDITASQPVSYFGHMIPNLPLPEYVGDTMLAAIFAGVTSGLGLGIIFIRGATTGGSDLVGALISKYIPFISIANLIMVIDIAIIIISSIVYNSAESLMYAVITSVINSKIIDIILYNTDVGNGKLMFIISKNNEEISKEIRTQIKRGVTNLKSRGGHTNQEVDTLMCAVRPQQVHKIYDIVHKIDSQAFIIVSDAGEIKGKGFKSINSYFNPLG